MVEQPIHASDPTRLYLILMCVPGMVVFHLWWRIFSCRSVNRVPFAFFPFHVLLGLALEDVLSRQRNTNNSEQLYAYDVVDGRTDERTT